MRAVFLLPVLLLLFAAGCGDGDIRRDPLMIQGDRSSREGNIEAAERFYRRLVERRPDAPEANLALATLYDEALADPASALYFYRRYLALAPDSSDRQTVEGYCRMARAKLLRELSREELPSPPADELARLTEENAALRRQIAFLKRYIMDRHKAQLRGASAPSSVSAPAPAQAPAREQPPQPVEVEQVYTVRAGDTPGAIARRFYGSASKYRLIMEANHLGNAAGLQVGQKLRIPPERPGEVTEKR